MAQDQQPGQSNRTDYHAYLLRLWRESPYSPWRAMLQDATTGQRHGFAGLTALWMYLRTQTGECMPCSDEQALASQNYQEEENHDKGTITQTA